MNNKLEKGWLVLLSMPKTIYFNMRTFGFAGLKLPVLVSYKTKIRQTHRGAIVMEAPVKPFMMMFGFGGSNGVISNRMSELCLEPGSKLIIKGNVQFAEGCSIRNSGTIIIGKKSGMNKNSFLSCYDQISLGDYFTAGWNVNIRDSDGHAMIKDGVKYPLSAPVDIGNHVWIGAHADILKGVQIKEHSVVAYRSLVTKSFEEGHKLIAGVPARIIRDNIDWVD